MTTYIILAILGIVCFFAFKAYKNKLKGGCCGVERTNQPINQKVKMVNKNNFTNIKEIKISGMSCDHCKTTIENLFNLNSNSYIDIDLQNNRAKLYSKDYIDNDEVIGKISSAGYKVIELKDL